MRGSFVALLGLLSSLGTLGYLTYGDELRALLSPRAAEPLASDERGLAASALPALLPAPSSAPDAGAPPIAKESGCARIARGEDRTVPADLARVGEVTPLMLAAARGASADVESLLAAGAAIDARNERGETALMLAARAGRAEVAVKLLERGARANARCARGMTALHHAAEGSLCTEVLAQLIPQLEEIDVRDEEGGTAFLVAVRSGHADVARALLDRRANGDLRDHRGHGAFDRLVEPRADLPAELERGLRATLALLDERRVDRRLALDPATIPILFRAELDALAAREGRPPLPPYEAIGSTAATLAATEKGAAVVGQAGVLLLPALRSDSTKPFVDSQVHMAYSGWAHAVEVVRRAVIRDLVVDSAHHVTLSGSLNGQQPFVAHDALLIERKRGSVLIEAVFLGGADAIRIEGKFAPRFGPQQHTFERGAFDLAPYLTIGRGADRVIVSSLNYGARGLRLPPIHLLVDGPRAASMLRGTRIEQVDLTKL